MPGGRYAAAHVHTARVGRRRGSLRRHPAGRWLQKAAAARECGKRQVQLLAIVNLRWSARLARLYSDMKRVAFPLVPATIADPDPQKELDRFSEVVWWGKAASSMENVNAPILADLARRLFAYNPGIGLHIAELGHACTFLSRLRMAAASSAGE